MSPKLIARLERIEQARRRCPLTEMTQEEIEAAAVMYEESLKSGREADPVLDAYVQSRTLHELAADTAAYFRGGPEPWL